MSRLVAAARLEFRVELRSQIVAVAAAMCALWTVLLLALPGPAAGTVAPLLLLLDTATFGALFIAALYLFERGEGALASLTVSPLRFGEYLGVKIGLLTGLSVAAAVPIALAAATPLGRLWMVLLGVAVIAALVLALSFLLALPYDSFTGYLTVAPLMIAPVLAVPLAVLVGLLDHPLAYLIPSTAAATLIRAGVTGDPLPYVHIAVAVVFPLLCAGVAVAVARARFARILAGAGARSVPPRADARTDMPGQAAGRSRRRGWVRMFAAVDLRSVRMDRLLAIVVAAPVALALALRLGYPPLVAYLTRRFGIDVAPYSDLVLALLVVVHVPIIMGMVASLLLLDDVDERRLQVLRVTPITLERYLTYRGVSSGLAALAGLLVAVPLSGLAETSLVRLLPALVLAAALAPLVVMCVASFAGDKVRGLALLKLLGGVVMGLASAQWWAPQALLWPPLLIPAVAVTAAQRAADADDLGRLTIASALGLITTVLGTILLAKRAVHRL
ncbi:MAG TPA: hypothetical protein VFY84_05465 [Jiangellales bacterium]|nr:hypothetical protein [Jiangellales bacterium]